MTEPVASSSRGWDEAYRQRIWDLSANESGGAGDRQTHGHDGDGGGDVQDAVHLDRHD